MGRSRPPLCRHVWAPKLVNEILMKLVELRVEGRITFEISGSRIGVAKDSCLMGCNLCHSVKWFPSFVPPSSSGSISPRRTPLELLNPNM